MSLEVRPLNAPLGAEIIGLDRRRPPDVATLAVIEQALIEHIAIVLPEAADDPDWLLAIGRQAGPLIPHVLDQYHHPATSEISIIAFNDDGPEARTTPRPAGSFWHSDLSYEAAPADAIFLYADRLPSRGGDTLVADMRRAYESLPEATKNRIEGLRATHRWAYRVDGAQPALSDDQQQLIDDVVHPVVRIHPQSGRKALFISPGYTVAILGLEPAESDALLAELLEHALKPEFQYRHQWRPGQLLGVDNRASMHCAIADYDEPRRMLRMIAGCTDPAYADVARRA